MFHCNSEPFMFVVDRDVLPNTCVFLEKLHVSLIFPANSFLEVSSHFCKGARARENQRMGGSWGRDAGLGSS